MRELEENLMMTERRLDDKNEVIAEKDHLLLQLNQALKKIEEEKSIKESFERRNTQLVEEIQNLNEILEANLNSRDSLNSSSRISINDPGYVIKNTEVVEQLEKKNRSLTMNISKIKDEQFIYKTKYEEIKAILDREREFIENLRKEVKEERSKREEIEEEILKLRELPPDLRHTLERNANNDFRFNEHVSVGDSFIKDDITDLNDSNLEGGDGSDSIRDSRAQENVLPPQLDFTSIFKQVTIKREDFKSSELCRERGRTEGLSNIQIESFPEVDEEDEESREATDRPVIERGLESTVKKTDQKENDKQQAKAQTSEKEASDKQFKKAITLVNVDPLQSEKREIEQIVERERTKSVSEDNRPSLKRSIMIDTNAEPNQKYNIIKSIIHSAKARKESIKFPPLLMSDSVREETVIDDYFMTDSLPNSIYDRGFETTSHSHFNEESRFTKKKRGSHVRMIQGSFPARIRDKQLEHHSKTSTDPKTERGVDDSRLKTKVKNIEEFKVKKVQINEFFKNKKEKVFKDFSKDYMSLLKSKKVTKFLDTQNCSNKIFSDQIYRYSKKGVKNRYIIMITYDLLCILLPKNYAIKKMIKLEDITKVVISEDNAILMSLHTQSNFDILIDTFNRFQMVRFLLQACEVKGIKRIKLSYMQK